MDDQKESSGNIFNFAEFLKKKFSGKPDPENDPDPSPVSPVASASVPKDPGSNVTELKGKPISSTSDENKKAA